MPPKAQKSAGKAGGKAAYEYRPFLMDRKNLVEQFAKLENKLRLSEARVFELEDALLFCDQQAEKHILERQNMMKLERIMFHTLTRLQAFLMQVVAISEGNKRADVVAPSIEKAESAISERLKSESDAPGDGGTWINDHMVTAYVEVANGVSREIESALFGEMQQKCELMARRLTEHANKIEGEMAEARQKAVAMSAEVDVPDEKPGIKEEFATLAEKNEQLQARLDELSFAKWKEQQEVLEAHLELRSFRDEVMKLLDELTKAITRKLGFIPHSVRHNINDFMLRAEELEGRFPDLSEGAEAGDEAAPTR